MKFILVSSMPAIPRDAADLDRGYSCIVTRPIKRPNLYECIDAAFFDKPARVHHLEKTRVPQGTNRVALPVLVAEDNEINAIVVRKSLEQIGCSVDLATNGEQALIALERKRYRFVILDILMPVMDGIDVAHAIRDPSSNVLDHDVPIIVTTALSTREDEMRCREAGVDHFLIKPVRREKFLAIFDNLLRDEVPKADVKERRVVLDTKELSATLDHDSQLVRSILAQFTATTESALGDIDAALRDNDPPAAKLLMHAIKGSCLNIGASAMAHEAAAAERCNGNTDTAALSGIAIKMREAFTETIAAIKQWNG